MEREPRSDSTSLPFEAAVYRECGAGGFSRKDCTVAFYTRVNALVHGEMSLLNVGAGRGANILQDRSAYRRSIQRFRGRVKSVIGIDIDAAINENPDLDVTHVVGAGARYPIEDESVDMIICDHVLEHVADPAAFAREIERVLRPGGWLCARTPNKWGYIGIGARLIPNVLHAGFLRKLQPHRPEKDVFSTAYRMNTFARIRSLFPHARWEDCSYAYNGVPGYHGGNLLLFRLIELWCWVMPPNLGAKLHIFLRKRDAGR